MHTQINFAAPTWGKTAMVLPEAPDSDQEWEAREAEDEEGEGL